MEVIKRIEELFGSLAGEHNYTLVDVTYRREGGKMIVRIIADKPGGITIDECAELNDRLGELLERDDIITEPYILEVSSPGLDRKLQSDRDFTWALGRNVRVRTCVPVDGTDVFSGVLVGLGEGTVVLKNKGISTEIPREKISKAKLDIDWSKR
jgi:ribosome maturation factor RimP